MAGLDIGILSFMKIKPSLNPEGEEDDAGCDEIGGTKPEMFGCDPSDKGANKKSAAYECLVEAGAATFRASREEAVKDACGKGEPGEHTSGEEANREIDRAGSQRKPGQAGPAQKLSGCQRSQPELPSFRAGNQVKCDEHGKSDSGHEPSKGARRDAKISGEFGKKGPDRTQGEEGGEGRNSCDSKEAVGHRVVRWSRIG